MIDIDCYDLNGCTGECPEGGWNDCPLNPEVGREAEFGRRFAPWLRAAAWFLACLLAVALGAALLPGCARADAGGAAAWRGEYTEALHSLLLVLVGGALWAAISAARRRPDPHELLVRMDDQRRLNHELEVKLAAARAEVLDVRERLGHKRALRIDSGGFHYIACGVCGIDLAYTKSAPGLQGCGGVRLTDEEWSAKMAARAGGAT